MIAVIGPENAGKTTLLAAWYLMIGRGTHGVQDATFAGSYTLSGWEAVARAMQWEPGAAPEFPPHTSTQGGREKGLLHLSFHTAPGSRRDYLFTDAPGLWFQKWALNERSAEGAGGAWIAANADAFLIVADSAALAGPDRSSARSSLQFLARRLAASRRGRPVILVWTKSDVAVDPEMKRSILDAISSQIPDYEEFQVSVRYSDEAHIAALKNLSDLFNHVLNIRKLLQILPPANASSNDPLFLVGARR